VPARYATTPPPHRPIRSGGTNRDGPPQSRRSFKDEETRMGTDAPRPETVRTGQLPHRWTRIDAPDDEAVVASYSTVIAGAGPAGLTAAYELTRHGHPCVVLEADGNMVGGISRTDQYKGYRFDIGGHRFFSKSDEVNRLWREILGDELITRSRMSRIYYDRKFFHYPLKPANALLNLAFHPPTLYL